MRISTFWYCLKQGISNICRNVLFSLASVATISACIFLFCLFFSLIANVRNITHSAEEQVGITVFFDEALTEEEIKSIGQEIEARPEIRDMVFTSEEEAWESFKADYFEGMEELAEGFAQDNPLAGSSSYTLYLNDITDQVSIVQYLESLQGVRDVIYSSEIVAKFTNINRLIGALSAVIIGILLAVAIFLISNTISVTSAFRKSENEIMRLIGATNFMIRAPFVVEGLLLGLAGALVPLGSRYVLYKKAAVYAAENFGLFVGEGGIFYILPIEQIFPSMAAVALGLGLGIGFFVSFFTIRKHLKV